MREGARTLIVFGLALVVIAVLIHLVARRARRRPAGGDGADYRGSALARVWGERPVTARTAADANRKTVAR